MSLLSSSTALAVTRTAVEQAIHSLTVLCSAAVSSAFPTVDAGVVSFSTPAQLYFHFMLS